MIHLLIKLVQKGSEVGKMENQVKIKINTLLIVITVRTLKAMKMMNSGNLSRAGQRSSPQLRRTPTSIVKNIRATI